MTHNRAETNKFWELFSKLCFASYPLAVVWAVWTSNTLIRLESTYVSQQEMKKIEEKFEGKIDGLPSQDIVQRMEKVEEKLDKMFDEIVALRILMAKRDVALEDFE